MRPILTTLFGLLLASNGFTQDLKNSPWHLVANNIDPNNYFGITSANGMIGLNLIARAIQSKRRGAQWGFDTYGRGRVSNILKVFNL